MLTNKQTNTQAKINNKQTKKCPNDLTRKHAQLAYKLAFFILFLSLIFLIIVVALLF